MDFVKTIDSTMATIEYGWLDKNGGRHTRLADFQDNYRLQSPAELRESRLGVCWDQVELERAALTESNKIACIVGGAVCAILIIYSALVSETPSFAAWAVYLSITGTTLFVKYLKLGKKHELIFGLAQLALALAFLITEFITKWPRN